MMNISASNFSPLNFVKTNMVFSSYSLIHFLGFISVIAIAYNVEITWISLPSFLIIVGVLSIVLGIKVAVCLWTVLFLAFYVCSFSKHNLSDFGIVYSDFYLIDRNLFDLILIDWRVRLAACGLVVFLLIETAFLRRLGGGGRHSIICGFALAAVGLALVPASLAEIKSARAANQEVLSTWIVGAVPSVATFVASATAPGLSTQMQPRADWADGIDQQMSEYRAATQPARKVNLFVILFESTFDPQYLGLNQIQLERSEILNPNAGVHGSLLVPAFGGGTWLTEFALMTGQSPWAFGSDAYNLNLLLEGKITGSTIEALRVSGYTSHVIYPYPGYFLHAESLYNTLNVGFVPPTKEQLLEFQPTFDDDLLYNRASGLLDRSQSNFQLIVTMLNHGPHDLNDPFGDYVKRFQEQEEKFAKFKRSILKKYPTHENYFLAFGDHQPYFAETLNFPKKLKHTTFWSLACVGSCAHMKDFPAIPDALGVEFLIGLALKGLKLPTGRIFVSHEALLKRGCTSLDFQCAPEDVNAFNWLFARKSLDMDSIWADTNAR